MGIRKALRRCQPDDSFDPYVLQNLGGDCCDLEMVPVDSMRQRKDKIWILWITEIINIFSFMKIGRRNCCFFFNNYIKNKASLFENML